MAKRGLAYYVDEDTYANEEFITRGFYKNAFATVRGAYLHLTIKCMRQREKYAEILEKMSGAKTHEERLGLQKELKKQEDIIDTYENYDIIRLDVSQMEEDKLGWRKKIMREFAEKNSRDDWKKEYFEHQEDYSQQRHYLVKKYSNKEEPERKKLFGVF